MSEEKKEEKMDRRKYIKYVGAGAVVAAAAAAIGYGVSELTKPPPPKPTTVAPPPTTVVTTVPVTVTPTTPPPPPKAYQLIKWNEPMPAAQRLTAPIKVGPIPKEWIEKYPYLLTYFPKGEAALEGYVLPEGWKEAVKGVEELVVTNDGALKYDPATVLNGLLFEKLTGIKVKWIEIPSPDMHLPKAAAIGTSRSKDIHVLYLNWPLEVLQVTSAGWAHPVDELWPPEVQKLYNPYLVEMLKGLDGKFYGIPFIVVPYLIYYRKSWLKGAGFTHPPESWEEYSVMVREVNKWAKEKLGPDYYGDGFPGADATHVLICISFGVYAQGGRLVKDGRFLIDSPEGRKSWEHWVSLFRDGVIPSAALGWTIWDHWATFAAGKLGFSFAVPSYTRVWADKEKYPTIYNDFDAIPILPWKKGGPLGSTHNSTDGLFINAFIDDNYKAAAMLYLDFMRSYQALFNEVVVEGNDSSMPAVYDHPYVKEIEPYYAVKKANTEAGVVEKFPPGFGIACDIIKDYFHKAALGKMDPLEALKECQKKIDVALGVKPP